MSSAKMVGKNRAPRVQIEYDVEMYGAHKKVELPFVMGVMSDLSGKPVDPLPLLAERKFTEFDQANFDTFDGMDDFSPGAVARNVEPLAKLLEARQQLANLITYMDGKVGAEELIAKVLADPSLLGTLGAAPKQGDASSTESTQG
jgi:type VI secretion system protein ImpB